MKTSSLIPGSKGESTHRFNVLVKAGACHETWRLLLVMSFTKIVRFLVVKLALLQFSGYFSQLLKANKNQMY